MRGLQPTLLGDFSLWQKPILSLCGIKIKPISCVFFFFKVHHTTILPTSSYTQINTDFLNDTYLDHTKKISSLQSTLCFYVINRVGRNWKLQILMSQWHSSLTTPFNFSDQADYVGQEHFVFSYLESINIYIDLLENNPRHTASDTNNTYIKY